MYKKMEELEWITDIQHLRSLMRKPADVRAQICGLAHFDALHTAAAPQLYDGEENPDIIGKEMAGSPAIIVGHVNTKPS